MQSSNLNNITNNNYTTPFQPADADPAQLTRRIDVLNAIRQDTNGYIHRQVQKDGLYLKHVSALLSNDRDLAVAAVAKNGLALQYVGEKCKFEAQKQVQPELWKNKDFVLKILNKGFNLQMKIDKKLWNDEEVGLAALKKDLAAVLEIDSKLLNNEDFVLKAILFQPGVVACAGDELLADKQFWIKAAEKNPLILAHGRCFQADVITDYDVVQAAFDKTGYDWVGVTDSTGTDNYLFYNTKLTRELFDKIELIRLGAFPVEGDEQISPKIGEAQLFWTREGLAEKSQYLILSTYEFGRDFGYLGTLTDVALGKAHPQTRHMFSFIKAMALHEG